MKPFRVKNVIFLGPYYLWKKDSFVHWLSDEKNLAIDASAVPLIDPTMFEPEIDVSEKKYWADFLSE